MPIDAPLGRVSEIAFDRNYWAPWMSRGSDHNG